MNDTNTCRITISQPILAIGDFENNLKNIKEHISEAISNGANLIVLPELSNVVKGANDLLCANEYLLQADKVVSDLLSFSSKIAILLGACTRENTGNKLLNSALLLRNNEITTVAHKADICDNEKKYFSGRCFNKTFKINSITFYPFIGSNCTDYAGADCVIRLASTPFVKKQIVEPINGVKNIFVNHVGLAQELIYEGGSFAADENGKLYCAMPKFQSDLQYFDISDSKRACRETVCNEEQIFKALSFAFKEFCRVNKFSKAVIGLSGGIDSALSAVIMCDAIGAENVLGITMPSKYSTEGSWVDSYELAKNLSMECKTEPIKPLFETFINEIQKKSYLDLAEENLQARLRGNILMAYSNRENRVLVSTGNKSEAAMGYCTLYGDTCGGINLIADLYKQEVYALSRWINRNGEIIPQNIITKAPSAELRPGQKDQDSLPEYEVLDEILYRWIEGEQTIDEISKDFDRKLVCEIINKLNIMEFKRNQFTYSLKISTKSLLDRNYPLVNAFRFK